MGIPQFDHVESPVLESIQQHTDPLLPVLCQTSLVKAWSKRKKTQQQLYVNKQI